MSNRPVISFAKITAPKKGALVVLTAKGARLSASAQTFDPQGQLAKAITVADFTGKLAASIELLAPHGMELERLAVVGVGKPDKLDA